MEAATSFTAQPGEQEKHQWRNTTNHLSLCSFVYVIAHRIHTTETNCDVFFAIFCDLLVVVRVGGSNDIEETREGNDETFEAS